MWLIVRNGIRRWWWMYLLAVAGSVFAVMDHDQPALKAGLMAGVIIYFGATLFGFEVGGFTKFRAFNTLPVSAMNRGRGFEILFVGVVPAIVIVAYLLGAVAYLIAPKLVPPPVPWLLYIKVVFLAIGSVCLFIQMSHLQSWMSHGRNTFGWNLGFSCVLMIFFVLTIYFIYRCTLPAGSEPLAPTEPFAWFFNGMERLIGPKKHAIDLPECVALGIAAASIAAAILKADAFSYYAMSLRREDMISGTFSPVSTRTYGFLDPWVLQLQVGSRVLGGLCVALGLFMCLYWILFGESPFKGWGSANWPLVLVLITWMLSIPPIVPWFVGLRALRMLPSSRKHLALYLISFQLLSFTAYSVILMPVCTLLRNSDYAINLEWWLVVAFGLSLLTGSLLLLSKHVLVGAVSLFAPMAATGIIVGWLVDPIAVVRQTPFLCKAGFGIVLFAVGYLSLYATLARNTPYRSKPWFGG